MIADFINVLLARWRRPRVTLSIGPTQQERDAALQKRADTRRSPLPEPGMYALEGEWVTCEGPANHRIMKFGRSVRYGELQDDRIFERWVQPRIEAGTRSEMCVCTECHHRWYDGMGGYHFKDGWR